MEERELKPSKKFRWKEADKDDDCPLAVRYGWEGARNYYKLQQLWHYYDKEGTYYTEWRDIDFED
jgi:hypothetical protein